MDLRRQLRASGLLHPTQGLLHLVSEAAAPPVSSLALPISAPHSVFVFAKMPAPPAKMSRLRSPRSTWGVGFLLGKTGPESQLECMWLILLCLHVKWQQTESTHAITDC